MGEIFHLDDMDPEVRRLLSMDKVVIGARNEFTWPGPGASVQIELESPEDRSLGPICKGTRGRRMSANYLPKVWKRLFERGGLLEGMPFVGINRMRATYATLMQSAGVDSTVINAMQGRSRDSRVLYSNYLSPYPATFEKAGRAMSGLLCTENSLGTAKLGTFSTV